MIVVIGVDVHKATHTAVAADEVGRQIGAKTVKATDDGHRQLLAWALLAWAGVEVKFGLEDCRAVSARLERALLGAGQQVVRVPPHLMAGARKTARTRGKSDPIDALAIARVVLREPDLPVARLDDTTRSVKLLVDHRDNLVAQRTADQNRLRWLLHELDPQLPLPSRGLSRLSTLDMLTGWLADQQPATTLTRVATELVADIRGLTARINTLEKELTELTATLTPQLLALPGCGPLTAAKLYGETANITRFRTEACYAMHAGTAPIPASSGNTTRHRLARGGNRQLNTALHRIALTQIRHHQPGHDYYHRRRSQGDTPAEALRTLKRRLARTIYNLLKQPALT